MGLLYSSRAKRRKIMHKKQNLPVEEIKHMLDEGLRQIDVAMFYNVTQSAISRIARMPEQIACTRESTTRMCSCCGARPIANGNRFLCDLCYKQETFEEHSLCAC
jgi:predicted XRE-type DNA-binding protein